MSEIEQLQAENMTLLKELSALKIQLFMERQKNAKAMEQALESLELVIWTNNPTVNKAITALREALAEQPALAQQEPVAWTVAGKVTDWSKDFSAYKTQLYVRPVYTTPPAPAQVDHFAGGGKPMAEQPAPAKQPPNCGTGYCSCVECLFEQPAQQEPDPDELTIAYMSGVYEGKKRKPWVGLTDEEIAMIHADYPNPQGFAKAIIAKLKEKNGYNET
jgi:hypothetical protein